MRAPGLCVCVCVSVWPHTPFATNGHSVTVPIPYLVCNFCGFGLLLGGAVYSLLEFRVLQRGGPRLWEEPFASERWHPKHV